MVSSSWGTRRWQIKAPFDVPDEVFRILELMPGGLGGTTGAVRYPEPFEKVLIDEQHSRFLRFEHGHRPYL
jgi:Predicted acetyltransferase